jgi:hypothetical protein
VVGVLAAAWVVAVDPVVGVAGGQGGGMRMGRYCGGSPHGMSMGRYSYEIEGGQLAPKLTAADRAVLDALNPVVRGELGNVDVEATEWLSEWEVAERVKNDDVMDVRLTLRGLEQQLKVTNAPWKPKRKRPGSAWASGPRYLSPDR